MAVINYVGPMTMRERYRATFTIYRAHFWKFMLIYLVLAASMASFVGLSYFFNMILKKTMTTAALYNLVFAPLTMLAGAAAVIATSNAVLKRPVKVLAAFKRAFSHRVLLSLITASIPMWGWVVIYSFTFSSGNLFIIGLMNSINVLVNIAYTFITIFVPAVCVLEHRGVIDNVERALALSLKNFGRVLLNYGVAFYAPLLGLSVLIGCIGAVFLMVYMFSNTNAMQADPQAFYSALNVQVSIFMVILVALFTLFLQPLANLIVLLLYFDIRARKERYNEEMLAEEMGYEPLVEMITA